MKRPVLWAIHGYQQTLSRVLPPACRFVPSCSEYAYEAIERYGIGRGGQLAAWRLLRCNPWGGHGYDPVPDLDVHSTHSLTGLSPVTSAPTSAPVVSDAPGQSPYREG